MNIEESIKEMKSLSPSEEAIETLLTAYEKEKGENIKLRLQDIPLIEGELKAYKDRVNELKQQLEKEKAKNKELRTIKETIVDLGKMDYIKFTNLEWASVRTLREVQSLNYELEKLQDKIKAKIEEVDYKMIAHQDVREAVKQTLQSLLEKE